MMISRSLIRWLVSIAFLIFLMVIIGGLTRLTGSGLSITQWKPITGAIPPLSLSDWQTQFQLYQKIPQFSQVNSTMTLDEFKTIFWWEWGHRFLGRLLGFVFIIPMIVFWLKDKIPYNYKPVFVGLLVGGGLQGLVGWIMVKSGLVDRTSVSQYRLALHLGLALSLYYSIVYVIFLLKQNRSFSVPRLSCSLGLTGLVFLQIISGAFTAGLHAGHTFNTWPFIDGSLIPQDLFGMGIVSLFEDILTVQFFHRSLAYVIAAYVLIYVFFEIKAKRFFDAILVLAVVSMQVFLGIITLITVAPVDHIEIAAFHQAGAVLVLTVCCYLNSRMRLIR